MTGALAIRQLVQGDEDVVRSLATSDGPGDPEGLLADSRTIMLVAFADSLPVGFVLAHETTGRRTRSTSVRARSPKG